MIIQSDSVGMNSARRYSSKQLSYSGLKVWNNRTKTVKSVGDEETSKNVADTSQKGLVDAAKNILEDAEKENDTAKNNQAGNSFEDLMERFKSTQNVRSVSLQERLNSINKIRQQTLDYLIYLLFGRKIDESAYENGYTNEYTNQNASAYAEQISYQANVNVMTEAETYGGTYSSWNYFSEQETTAFSTKGTVVTADGRSIDFNIELEMSRSFVETTSSIIDFGAVKFKDPLVINLDCGAAEVTDQKFYFDLDADGNEEYISMLGSGSGYLALDKNNDGAINDGSELFGTASGNGFLDLAQYDSDGNGWIDEADEIFNRLKIWTMDSEGNSSLIALGKAGVGAIYLGSTDTEFSLNNEYNVNNAVIRKTGMFLYENGGAGTIQQLDLAT